MDSRLQQFDDWRPIKALEPTADSAMFFAQEVSDWLEPQFGGGSALSR
jgi:hypothetical protein